jgi:hypothetical protein
MGTSLQPASTQPVARSRQARIGDSTRRSLLIYLALMVYLVVVKVVLSLASVKAIVASQAAAFSWPVIGLLGATGLLSVWLGPRTGFPELWDARVSNRQRLLVPALLGLGLGVVFLVLQATTQLEQISAAEAHVASVNVPFPASLLFYSGGAIIVEALYRLVPITLVLWVTSNVILRKRAQTQVFWVLAIITSALEPVDQIGVLHGHLALMVGLGVTMYAINLLQAYLFRRFGFVAPLVMRLAYYLLWHILGGAIG